MDAIIAMIRMRLDLLESERLNLELMAKRTNRDVKFIEGHIANGKEAAKLRRALKELES